MENLMQQNLMQVLFHFTLEIMSFKNCFFLWMESIQSTAGLFVLSRNQLQMLKRALLDGKNLAGRMLRELLEFYRENFNAWQDPSTLWT